MERRNPDAVPSQTTERSATERVRRPYARPELKAFGRVEDLTRGGSGNSSDKAGKRRFV